MCGIFALLNNLKTFNKEEWSEAFSEGACRGPEISTVKCLPMFCRTETVFGFHRLAINGLDISSNQPITIGHITLICNGEIYNYKQLYSLLNITPVTNSDCEVIIHLYRKFGIEQTLQLLDGVFAFILCDNFTYDQPPRIIVARDPYGVRPLYVLRSQGDIISQSQSALTRTNGEDIIAFASELKVLSKLLGEKGKQIRYTPRFGAQLCQKKTTVSYRMGIKHILPGSYSVLERPFQAQTPWKFLFSDRIYSTFNFGYNLGSNVSVHIYESLCEAVKKRVIGTTERPIACLLSGGLDSSLVTALVNKYYDKPLETYSIGLTGSEDLKNARLVADHLKTKHTEINVTEEEFLSAIPSVIYTIESYDTTTVRASVGNYLLGKYIAKHSEAKVIFNGDGADELAGGYLYFHKAPGSLEFDGECKRLLRDIHMYDVLRSDKSISSHGLEPRTPFLDRSWVQFYMSLPPSIRNHALNEQCEKYLIRKAFKEQDPDLLPTEVLWRRKEAFSDGVSATTRSWFDIIRERIEEMKKIRDPLLADNYYAHNPPKTLEQLYYRNIFEQYYPNCADIVPYFWMPKYVDAEDASARTLDIY